MKSMSSRLDQCEEKYGETERQFLLHTEMLCQQNDKFEKLDHDAKPYSLFVKNIPEKGKTWKEDIEILCGILKINLTLKGIVIKY